MRIVSTMVLMALVNSMFLAGCASVRGPARLARLQEASAVEPANQSWDAVVAIPLDSPLEVDLDSGERMRGRFRVADEQTLVLGQVNRGNRSVPRTEIQRVAIIRGTDAGTGALWGLGIGGVIMFLTANDEDFTIAGRFFWALIGGGIGTGIGALIGTAFRDRTVIYEAPVPGTTN